MKKLLVFHPIIAPYRIDFFNSLSGAYESKICLLQNNLKSQKFNYKDIEKQLAFEPIYLLHRTLHIPRGIVSVLRNFNPEIVLVSECGIVSLMVILYRFFFRKKYKIVSIIDDSYNMIGENNQFSWKHKLAERILIPCFDNIINVEPRVADYFQKKYKKGVCFPIIVDGQKARERYEGLLNISERLAKQYDLIGKKILLFVGRLVELKNLQKVIPAFSSIDDSNLRFIIIGSGTYENQLIEMAKNDSRIMFLGRKEGDELYAWYNVAQCFILPSYQEPFGAVTNEALLAGCISLISNKAGSQCLIIEGTNGSVFNPYNVTEIKRIVENKMSIVDSLSLPLTLKPNLMRDDFKARIAELITMLDSI